MQDALLAQILIGIGIFIWCVSVIVPMAVSDDTLSKYTFSKDPYGLKFFFSLFIIPLIVIMFGLLVSYRVI
jgi:hypothetical protein